VSTRRKTARPAGGIKERTLTFDVDRWERGKELKWVKIRKKSSRKKKIIMEND
jgi:hypothetical protein